jgi:hypothetical protein
MNMSHLKIYLAVFVSLIGHASARAQDATLFTFDGSVDNVWTTTGNWTPSYPGTSNSEGEIIIIDALCRASGMNIEIGGGLVINPGKNLGISATGLNVTGTMTIHGELTILSNGTFTNSGYTTLESTGEISNTATVVNESTLVIEGTVVNYGLWENKAFAEMQLLSMAAFDNRNKLANSGTIEDYSSGFINNLNFDNRGEFVVSGAFINAANVTNLSTIFIEGNWIARAGSNLFNHNLLDISADATLMNSGTTYNFSAALLSSSGTIINTESGTIYNQGRLTTKGGVNFMLKPGSYLENRPGSEVTVN